MERRRCARVSATIFLWFKSEEAFIDAYTRDISAGGLFIKSKVVPPLNSIIKIKLKIPHLSAPLELEGRVVHIIDERKAEVLKTAQGFGVEFVDVDNETKEILTEVVEEIRRRRRLVYGRRRCPRMPYETDVVVRFKELEVNGRILDISIHGAFISTKFKGLKSGDELEIEMREVGRLKRVKIRAKVIHHLDKEKATAVGKEEGYGVEFINLPDDVYREIYALMERWFL